jgi:hypothetical protein
VDKDPVEMPPTQIGRALRELGITWIAAHSPQAKGRVERNFGTAQDRLVKGMRVAGVKTMAQANQYLEEGYLVWWERELTVEAAHSDDGGFMVPDRDRPKREFALKPSRHSATAASGNPGHSSMRFSGMTESIGPMWSPHKKPYKPEGAVAPPVGRPSSPSPRTRRKDRALPIVRDEFRPAIPRSGCSPALPVCASPARPE